MADLLPPEVVDEFRTSGFVVTPDVLTPAELERFGQAVDAAVTARTASDHRSLSEKSDYEQSFVQCMRLWETDPDVAPLTFHPKLAQAAAELLGVAALRLWQDQALYKEPGGRITDAHQDATLWPVGDAPMITAWIPFDGSTVDGGAMGYVPGSHVHGKLRTVNLRNPADAYDILTDPALDGTEPVVVEAPPGSVVWHHGFTVHLARANNGDEMRRVFTVVYLADGHRRAKPWPNFPLDRAGVEVGELMQGEGLPVVWPHADQIPQPSNVIGQATGPQVGP
jgi:ectoine hydroxylase-related dioxygenase (phytanoyl-CoA dioxygenase family)